MHFPGTKTAILITGMITLAVLYIIANVSSIPVSPTAGYFLSVARDMAAGKELFTALQIDYTPLSFYLFEGWIKISGANYTRFLLLQFLFHFGNMILVYLCARTFTAQKSICWLFGGLYFLLTMTLDGLKFTLEPFMMFWVLGAYFYYIRSTRTIAQSCWIGILIGTAILFKQHAVLFLPAFMFMFMIDTKRFSVQTLTRICATGLTATIPLLLFILLSGQAPYELFIALSRIGASTLHLSSAEELSRNSLQLFFSLLREFWISIPVGAFLYFRIKQQWPDTRGSLIPLILFTITPLLLKPHMVYFQMVAPWIILLWVKVVSHCIATTEPSTSNRYLRSILLAAAAVLGWCGYLLYNGVVIKDDTLVQFLPPAALAIFAIASLVSKTRMGLKDGLIILSLCALFIPAMKPLKTNYQSLKLQKMKQFKLAAMLHEYFPRGSEVLVLNAPELHFLGKYTSPLDNYILSFQSPISVDGTLIKDWKKVPKVIIRGKNLELEKELVDNGYTKLKTPFSNHSLLELKTKI
ncbi:MAG: glycosyltransferase family 39 protein [Desulfovibrio sp.]